MLTSALPRRRLDFPGLLTALLAAAITACVSVMLVLLAFAVGSRLLFSGKALPGVSAAGIDLTGLSREQIEAALGEAFTYPQQGAVVLQDSGRYWAATPAELGLAIDAQSMAERALVLGRQGSLRQQLVDQSHAWAQGVDLPLAVIFDQRTATAYLQRAAAEIDRPPVEAALHLQGQQIESTPGSVGRLLDIPGALAALEPAFALQQDVGVVLPVLETRPRILDAEADAALARTLLSRPLVLKAEGAGPWTLEPAALASMLEFTPSGDPARVALSLSPGMLSAFLDELAPDLERKPENARFIFNDDARQLDLLREAVIGRSLDTQASILAIEQAINRGESEASLVFHIQEPAVGSDATANSLGITENVVAVSTYFSGSSEGRIQNIKTAASQFHGLLIAPGETVSMAELLGDISLDNGYTEALIIYGNRTIQGVGGGVCQVSTTLFRAAFFGGYPILERNPHAYRVLYYEQGPRSPGPGMDATVFVPRVDFKFQNDTPYWLLMETYLYGEQLLWKFYSTSDGRGVEWSSSGPNNVEEAPKPLYRENEDLKKGKIKQVDYEADGMDIAVYRTVTRQGEALYQDTIKTHYLPWRAIYEFGPGTQLPDDVEVEH
ncbi:MAG: VanW family protein [Anaerolineales bacterium]|nr:VanW family protein [Anaerolineales bacterium]